MAQEVIEISDDDDPPRRNAPSHANGKSPSNSGRKSGSNLLRPDSKLAYRPTLSQRSGDISSKHANSRSPENGNQSASKRFSLGSKSQQSPRLKTSSSQDMQSRKAQESGVNLPTSSEKMSRSSQKRAPEPIDLSVSDNEDEGKGRERPVPNKFVVPRGFEPNTSVKSPSRNATPGSPFIGGSVARKKRPFENDSSIDDSSPSKRPKQSNGEDGKETGSNFQSELRDAAKRRPGSSSEPRDQAMRRSRPSGIRGEVDLTSPDSANPQRSPLDRGGRPDIASTQNTKSPSSTPFGDGRNAMSASIIKPSKDGPLSDDLDGLDHNPQASQQDKTSKSTQRQTGLSDRQNQMTLREQRVPGRGGPNLTEGETPLLDSSEAASSGYDSTTNLKTRSSKIRSPAVNRQANGAQTSISEQGSARKKRPESEKPPDSQRNTSAKDQPSSQRRQKSDRVSSPESDDLEQHKDVNPKLSIRAIKSTRKISTEEGQKHMSPSPGNRGQAQRKAQRRPENVTDRPAPMNEKTIVGHALIEDGKDATGSQRNNSKTLDSLETYVDIDGLENAEIDASASKQVSAKDTITDAEEADFQLRSEALQGAMEKEFTGDSGRVFAAPTISASALKASSIYSNLPLANRVEKVLGKYLEELRGDNEYWTSVLMCRARLTQEDERNAAFLATSKVDDDAPTSFRHLEPLEFSLYKKGGPSARAEHEIWGIQRMTTDGKAQATIEMSMPYVKFVTDTQDVPNYAHYVSIKNNILAPNVIHLHCWPYFGDDFDMSKVQNLHEQYKIDIVDRERKLLLLLKAQKYEDYVGSALHDLECTWSDVLRFLLELNPDVGSDLDARKAYQSRPQFCQEDFSRTSERWEKILNGLPPSTPEKLGRAAVLCENFQKMAKFSIWHIARTSEFAKSPEELPTSTKAKIDDNELTCRVCLRFNCPYHGQYKHIADDSGSESDAESEFSVDSVVATDIINPLKANYRSRIAFPRDMPSSPKSSAEAPPRKKQKDPNYWANYRHKAEDRGPFYPCHHPGTSCEDAKCRCFERMIPCEKSCGCPPDCSRKFKGCSCGSKKGHKLVCFEDAECACWQLGRECDPDLCGACGVCDVVDPINKYNENVLISRCRNASIQRGVPKHTLLGDSGIHGLGLYACENIKQNDFVGEYKGEIITKKEADRRGAVYEHQKLSYLFSLNKAQEIDSTYFGNKVRFINHAHGEKANLYPRIIMVNTVHRIGLYAGKDILAGKELLFDYGPFFPDEQLQGKKSKKSAPPESKKSAPHVRNANLVKEFFDVEESEDEDGILRAKAVSHSAADRKGKAKGKKPRGGDRTGTAKKPHTAKATHRETLQDLQTKQNLGPDAGERLAAFNISDDVPSENMDLDADDDDVFEPEASESESSEESDESERIASEDEEDELARERGHRRRGGFYARRFRRV